jgi:prolyl-tRNA synthetase
MRLSQLFGLTLREAPADTHLPGHILLLRGGFLRSAAPDFALLPIGQRVYRRLLSLLQAELEDAGGQETGPTADILSLARSEIHSHRHLPRLLYRESVIHGETQAQGLFGVKIATALSVDVLTGSRTDVLALGGDLLERATALCRRLGVEVIRARSGFEQDGLKPEGLYFVVDHGSQAVLRCPKCAYAAIQPVAGQAKPGPESEAPLALEEISTPDCPTIESLARFLDIPASRTAKALMFTFHSQTTRRKEFLFVVVRGDTTLSMAKLQRAVGPGLIEPATVREIQAAGAEPGYASPIGLKRVRVLVDDWVTTSPNLAAGANKAGFHVRNSNFGRDYKAQQVLDLVEPGPGDPCPHCGEAMDGIHAELLVQLKFTPPIADGPLYSTEDGSTARVWHAQLVFDLGRSLAAIAESHHDAHGITFPAEVAPYDVHLVWVPGKKMDTRPAADELYDALEAAGLEVLYDDREERAGVKFNDADLIGCPVRVTAGERALEQGMVEVKLRTAGETQSVETGEAVKTVRALLQK